MFQADQGGTLTLIGSLGSMKALAGLANFEIIHGLADNKLVTIYRPYLKTMTTSFPGPHKQILISSQVFVNAHLNEVDMNFNRVDIATEYMPEFVNRSSLTYSMGHTEEGKWTGLKAEVVSQDPIEIGPVKGGKAFVKFGWGQSSDPFRNITIRENCAVSIDLNRDHSLSEIMSDYVRPIQDLVTLGTDRPNAITSLSLQSSKILREEEKPVSIDYYAQAALAPKRTPKDTLMRPHMLFALSDLKHSQLNKWLIVTNRFGPVVGILFGQRYSKSTHLENQLLNAVSAAEAYHRRRFENTVLDKATWKARKKKITSKVDKDDVDFVNSVLQFANEKRLRTRLEEIVDHSGLSGDLMDDPAKWNKDIRDYRNTLTHYDPDSPTEIKDYEHLYRLAESLSWVMLACLMVEMGFRQKEVLALFGDNERYKFTRERLKDSKFTGVSLYVNE